MFDLQCVLLDDSGNVVLKMLTANKQKRSVTIKGDFAERLHRQLGSAMQWEKSKAEKMKGTGRKPQRAIPASVATVSVIARSI
jgi:hypothetical protein